ncbi:uncharacterized protein LOC115034092 isoform X2 [Acyrthosiphon pisum]|uniref:Uncharacterized protein n=1 Tax=Acyrthosiphon pisum TaxID=7029 RepID=A0A8R2JRS1_ACYPI|nr:uncharacterized protein LOC115034092 isoform X2 [Acyrthosiphon pisum]XP_029345589.1 uncharacterized protein LOC115034092 isoform X2 [Acyrthosiphon pisum]
MKAQCEKTIFEIFILKNFLQFERMVEEIGDVVKKKIHAVTDKNPGYIDFKTINDIMSGRHTSKNLELSPSDIMRFKYAPITSVDVERSFSRFKNILRRHLTFENLKEIVIIQYNKLF